MHIGKSVRLAVLATTLIGANANAEFNDLLRLVPSGSASSAITLNFLRTPQWVTLARQGSELRSQGKLEAAADAFKVALSQLQLQEASSDPRVISFGPVRLDFLMAYGDVLNRLDRPDEALPLLQQAAAIEKEELDKRAQRSTSSMSHTDAMAAFRATMSTAMNMARQLNRKGMVYESDNGIPFEESLAEQLPDTQLTSLLLADAYSRKGDKQSVLNLYDGQFQAYLRRQRENSNPAARFNLDLAVESAFLRFSLVLSRVGPSTQQDQAFKCALDMNLANQRSVGTNAITTNAQESIASQRRLFVGAFADQAMRNSATDLAVQRRLVELIADSKGLSTRYAQSVRKILFHSDNPTLAKLRPKFDELEKSRANLPISGNQAVLAMVEWENSRANLMRDALPQLKAEGLGDIFVDGATLLKRAQQKLGEETLIGYSIYKPLDLKTMAPLAARVLRYTVTNTAVQVQDIGALKELESLVLRWRSAVAMGGDTAAIPASQRLLSGLPASVMQSKRWVIDPDGIVSLVPFEALNESNGDAVVAHHAVRYVSSIASLASTVNTSATPSQTALVVANPVFKGNAWTARTDSIMRLVPTASGALIENLQLSPLPHTLLEASMVEGSLKRLGLNPEMRLGEAATLDAMQFKSAPRFLHIATHGIYMAPGTDPNSKAFIRVSTVIPGMQSALVFTPNANGALFTGADFARLPLNGTELVVLSACDTGNGSLNVGEGVGSLRMAVEEAGAKSSVTSLWPVPSEATSKLMGYFYEQLALGLSKSDALREAKLQLMKTHPKPNQWAGFLLAGQP